MGKKILVTYDSKYGATAEIADRISTQIKQTEFDVDVLSVKKIDDIEAYNSIIIGSAVYIGQWRKAIKTFIKTEEKALSEKNVWFFSSGPTGEGEPTELTKGWKYPESLQPFFDKIKPVDIALFHGEVKLSRLNFIERFMAKKVESPIGDYRDWDAIEKWASTIVNHLKK